MHLSKIRAAAAFTVSLLVTASFLVTAPFLASTGALAQSPRQAGASPQSTRDFVRTIVNSEITADTNDHSRWMYRDSNKTPSKSTVTLVVQTASGDLSKTIEINGKPLTTQQQAADLRTIHRFVTDTSVRRKQQQSEAQDNQRATALTRMLPNAFLWTITGKNGNETTLSFQPDPNFSPPTLQARVFAAMQGTMVVNTEQKRIKSLKGTLVRDVNFGFGLLGRLLQGGTFHVERQQIAPQVWEITSTHVHIQGHALLFKSIGEQQDETTSGYKPTPNGITLDQAEKMLNDGTVAREVGAQPSK